MAGDGIRIGPGSDDVVSLSASTGGGKSIVGVDGGAIVAVFNYPSIVWRGTDRIVCGGILSPQRAALSALWVVVLNQSNL